MRKPFLAAVIFTVSCHLLTPSARADETSIWADAFPAVRQDAATGVGSISTGQALATASEATLALVGAPTLMTLNNEIGLASNEVPGFRLRATLQVAAQKPAYKDLLYKQLRMERLESADGVGALTATEKEELKLLKDYFVEERVDQLEANRHVEAARQKLLSQEIIDGGRYKGLNPEEYQQRKLSEFKKLKALTVAGIVALLADGSLRIVNSLTGRDPGYSPAVNLSRSAIKHALPEAPAAKPAAGEATMSAN